MNRILLMLLRKDGDWPSVCLSSPEDVNVHQFMTALVAFGLALGYNPVTLASGLRQALAEVEDTYVVRGQGDRV